MLKYIILLINIIFSYSIKLSRSTDICINKNYIPFINNNWYCIEIHKKYNFNIKPLQMIKNNSNHIDAINICKQYTESKLYLPLNYKHIYDFPIIYNFSIINDKKLIININNNIIECIIKTDLEYKSLYYKNITINIIPINSDKTKWIIIIYNNNKIIKKELYKFIGYNVTIYASLQAIIQNNSFNIFIYLLNILISRYTRIIKNLLSNIFIYLSNILVSNYNLCVMTLNKYKNIINKNHISLKIFKFKMNYKK
jgi:hypothetical protein